MMVLCLIAIFALSGGWDHPWVHKANDLLRKKIDGANNGTGSLSIDNLIDVNEKEELPTYNTTGPRIAFIAYSYMGNMTKFEELVIGALETSMENEPIFFVVMSNEWKDTYREFCSDEDRKLQCKKLIIIWVDCKEGWYGTVGCCKAQKGLLQVYEKYGTDFDYFLYQDDDDYLRVDMLKRFLEPFPAEEAFTVGSTEPRKLAESVWDVYYCSDDQDFKYPWGQPVIYSRGALEVISNGLRLNGLLSECVAYGMLHDVGFQIFNWMYSLPALLISLSDHYKSTYNREITQKEEGVFGYHGILNDHIPDGVPPSFDTMQEAHEYYQTVLGEPAEFDYKWYNATGFRSTWTFSIYQDPTTWEDAWMKNDRRECKALDDSGEEAWNKKKEEEKRKEEKKKREEEERQKEQNLIDLQQLQNKVKEAEDDGED
eukprot:CAMPEP_0194254102 /NCGR_PEP_ID=MMETSP0158-20130606/31366_1 /TAXON_ID=33649 /ORGANISM="Thalassionema nitzschioides, Strain L26-B" /LENGTH=427 /DNA_ID=CAMNT_0038992017 /DNA_START=118 /DNA_END=1401 /DNA_ORIENTATION=-